MASREQNNQIEVVTVDHLSSLHHLETLNLQNNWLSTEGNYPIPYLHRVTTP